MSERAAISLLIDKYAPEGQFSEFINELGGESGGAAIIRRPAEGPSASLDWLIPTGIILLVAKPYYETILKRMAEDHYALIKKATAKLWNKFLGPKPEIERVVHTSGGAIKESIFSRAFSITVMSVSETKITLLFLNGITPEDFNLAVDKFMDLMAQHHACGGKDQLTTMMEARELPPSDWQQLVYLNPKTKQLELIDYVMSSQLSRLTSDEISKRKA
jgi:hypothetical protein